MLTSADLKGVGDLQAESKVEVIDWSLFPSSGSPCVLVPPRCFRPFHTVFCQAEDGVSLRRLVGHRPKCISLVSNQYIRGCVFIITDKARAEGGGRLEVL